MIYIPARFLPRAATWTKFSSFWNRIDCINLIAVVTSFILHGIFAQDSACLEALIATTILCTFANTFWLAMIKVIFSGFSRGRVLLLFFQLFFHYPPVFVLDGNHRMFKCALETLQPSIRIIQTRLFEI